MSREIAPPGSLSTYSGHHLEDSDVDHHRYASASSDSDSEEEEKAPAPPPPAEEEMGLHTWFSVSAEQSKEYAQGSNPTLNHGKYLVVAEPEEQKKPRPLESVDGQPNWASIQGRGPEYYYTAAHLGVDSAEVAQRNNELRALIHRGEELPPEWRNRLQTFVACDDQPRWVTLDAAKTVEKWTPQNGLRGGSKGARWEKAVLQKNVERYANIFPRPLYEFHLANVENKKPRSKPAPSAGKTTAQQLADQLAAFKPVGRELVAFLDQRQLILGVLGAWTDAQFDSSSAADINDGVGATTRRLAEHCKNAQGSADVAEAFQREYAGMSDHDKRAVHGWVNCLAVADPSHALHLVGVCARLARRGVKRPASSSSG